MGAPGKAEQFMLIGPQDGFVLLGVGTAQNVVQVQNDILSSVADDHKEGALLLLQYRGLATVIVTVRAHCE